VASFIVKRPSGKKLENRVLAIDMATFTGTTTTVATTNAESILGVEPSRAHRKVNINGEDVYLNSKIVTVLCLVAFCKGKLYFAAMKYGDKYDGRSAHKKYGFSTGARNLGEALSGKKVIAGKTYGGCVEREAMEELNINLYNVQNIFDAVYLNDLPTGIPSRISYEDLSSGSMNQYISCAYTVLVACDALPELGKRDATGNPVPYGETDDSGRFEVECADWVLVEDVITGKIPFAYGQNGLAAVMFKDEIPAILGRPLAAPEYFYTACASATAVAEQVAATRKKTT
jgi:hypothetical protein